MASVEPAADTADTGAQADAPWRTLEYFATTRVIVASALVLGAAAIGFRSPGAPAGLQSGVLMALGYFGASALFAGLALYFHRMFRPQVFGQLALDLAAVTTLVISSGGVASGWVILYLLPLAGASLLLPPLQVFFVCSIAVLAVLIDAGLRAFAPDAGDSMIFQAGIFGASLFAVSALLRALSARLANQERLARIRGRDLQNQLAINRLVIAQMEQGVIVVDRAGRVRANNRGARRMLGLDPAAQLTGERMADLPAAAGLAAAFSAWCEGGRSEGQWSNTIVPSTDARAPVAPEARLHARFARPSAPTSDEFVIFIEDVRDVEDRAQQLKLAAMGRLTASIAHEIRNPLAAISNAGQLLNEDARDPVLKRLATIVRENTQRLNRLVEDVLRVARREPPLGDEIVLSDFVREFLGEFVRDRGLSAATIQVQFAEDQRVKFEQSHLRQVLYNLVDNALRYASGQPGSVLLVVEPAPEGDRPMLWVMDDGPGVPYEARAALFEPFFTTRNQGTGLGLYLAREFCVTNRADLSYAVRREIDGSSREGFLLRFGQGARADASLHGFLDTIPVR
ncbi:MAG TPA: histidine kinase dimerization/phospho-acceptor domain-containing protein [Burkholderiaceae bacterium]|nr:histidine kinase dimerization/phospho-acceptor domain-containing protein [Burkholderiaceae bacterium]